MHLVLDSPVFPARCLLVLHVLLLSGQLASFCFDFFLKFLVAFVHLLLKLFPVFSQLFLVLFELFSGLLGVYNLRLKFF